MIDGRDAGLEDGVELVLEARGEGFGRIGTEFGDVAFEFLNMRTGASCEGKGETFSKTFPVRFDGIVIDETCDHCPETGTEDKVSVLKVGGKDLEDNPCDVFHRLSVGQLRKDRREIVVK